MSDFSTAYSTLKVEMSKLDSAISALESNTDPSREKALLENLFSVDQDVSVADQEVSSTLAQEQALLENHSASVADSLQETTTTSNLVATVPVKLTTSSGNERARMALDDLDNIWLVWQSSRTGIPEIYVAKYFGKCGVWGTSGMGGEEKRISDFGSQNRRSLSPNIAVGKDGEAHVVFQAQSEGGKWDIYYCQSTGKGASFSPPLKITNGQSNALMPDVCVSQSTKQDIGGSSPRVTVVWHDDRFGDFEIMAAEKLQGSWSSSGQGRADTRVTQAAGNSMFPRISSDNRGNLRVVYHDDRRGEGLSGIYMSTFVGEQERWESSGQGGQDRLISNGPADSLHPDIAIDETGGISVAWHDLRDAVANPDFHEEVYALYCPRQGHPGVHYPPLQPNIEARLDVDLQIKESVTYQNIDLTNVPEVSLAIKAPNATFWRAANEDGNYSEWQQFKPNFDLETMIVPWTLICTGGKKRICVQVQDAEMVAFPICKEVVLTLQPLEFDVEFFHDDKMTEPLASFGGKPVTSKGNIYVKFSSKSPQILSPKFDVIGARQRLAFNQETEALEAAVGGAGIGSYIGKAVTETKKGDVSPAALAFSAAAGRTFKGRFEVKRHDGLLNVDGLARVIVHPRDLCGEVKTASKEETAERAPVGKSSTIPDLRTDKPSNELNKLKKPPPPPNPPPPPAPRCESNTVFSGGDPSSSLSWDVGFNFGHRYGFGTIWQAFVPSSASRLSKVSLWIRGNASLQVMLGSLSSVETSPNCTNPTSAECRAGKYTQYTYAQFVEERQVPVSSDGSSPVEIEFSASLAAGKPYILFMFPTTWFPPGQYFQMSRPTVPLNIGSPCKIDQWAIGAIGNAVQVPTDPHTLQGVFGFRWYPSQGTGSNGAGPGSWGMKIEAISS